MKLTRRQLLFLVGGGSFGAGFGSGIVFKDVTNSDNTGNNGSTSGNWPRMGAKDTPLTMVYWGDYQCPYCTKFYKNTWPKIKQNYIKTGQLQFIEKPVALFGKDSERAALSAHCVWNNTDQETYWKWNSVLHSQFINSNGKNSGWAKPKNLAKYAQSIQSLDGQQLSDCVTTGEYANKLRTAIQDGKTWGLQGTPFFLIHKTGNKSQNRKIFGAQPYSRFKSVLTSI